MTTASLHRQWDRPLTDRARDLLAAEARADALRHASEADLRELGTRLAFASTLASNGDRYAAHVARCDALKPHHVNGLASIRAQAEDARSEAEAWWAERCPGPDPAAVRSLVARALASGPFTAPADAPEAAAPCDGLPVPEGYRWLGDTRGRKLPDGSRGTPHALFLRESDLTVWVRCRSSAKAGQLAGYAGPPPSEILGTRPASQP